MQQDLFLNLPFPRLRTMTAGRWRTEGMGFEPFHLENQRILHDPKGIEQTSGVSQLGISVPPSPGTKSVHPCLRVSPKGTDVENPYSVAEWLDHWGLQDQLHFSSTISAKPEGYWIRLGLLGWRAESPTGRDNRDRKSPCI